MTPRHRRWLVAGVLTAGVAATGTLVVNAMRSNLVFFYTPTQVAAREAPADRTVRLGGLVAPGSVRREGVTVHFEVTDTAQAVAVRYEGALPDLFREGRGVVAQGRMHGGTFVAREILAKHDETYMPPEAQDAVDRAHAATRDAASPSATVPATAGARP